MDKTGNVLSIVPGFVRRVDALPGQTTTFQHFRDPLQMKSMLLVLLFPVVSILAGCGDSMDLSNTAEIQEKIDQGGVVTFAPGTYVLTKTIVVRKSNTTIQGAGPETMFVFEPDPGQQVHCVNDRAFTTPCDVEDHFPARQIVSPITSGDTAFTTAVDVSDLQPGDWLIVGEKDSLAGDYVGIDWVQVASAMANTVRTATPFRISLPDARPFDTSGFKSGLPSFGYSGGLAFRKIPHLVEGVQFRNLTVRVPDSGAIAPGISVFAAKDILIDSVSIEDENGQALYSYMAKGLTIRNSSGYGTKVLNEFGATVDLKLENNTFSASRTAALGLDFGTGFFQVTGNTMPMSTSIGAYLLIGVHDGFFTNNSVSIVHAADPPGNTTGILLRGTSDITVTDNLLI